MNIDWIVVTFRSNFFATVMLLFGVFFLGEGEVVVNSLEAAISPVNRSEIVIRWSVSREVEVQKYTLKRKMIHDDSFQFLTDINPAAVSGTGHNYEYIDRNVFKSTAGSEPVIYELHVDFADGTSRHIGQAEVNYTATAIRRTWGSIKAMFQ